MEQITYRNKGSPSAPRHGRMHIAHKLCTIAIAAHRTYTQTKHDAETRDRTMHYTLLYATHCTPHTPYTSTHHTPQTQLLLSSQLPARSSQEWLPAPSSQLPAPSSYSCPCPGRPPPCLDAAPEPEPEPGTQLLGDGRRS
jgi:hypothetical protein